MNAKNISGNTINEIKSALVQLEQDGFQATLAIVFLAERKLRTSVTQTLNKRNIAIFGTTSEAVFNENGVLDKPILIMLMDLAPSSFKIALNKSTATSIQLSKEIRETGLTYFSHPAFIISVANLANAGDEIIRGLRGNDDIITSIFGGYAGDGSTWQGDVFTNDKSTDNGCIALILDTDKIDINGVAVSGWKPFGIEKTVTKSSGTWIEEIDNQPAVDVLTKFVGNNVVENESSESIKKIDTTTYVLQAVRDGDSPGMIATLEYSTETGAIRCSTPIPVGLKFRFSLPPDFEVIETVIKTSESIKRNVLPQADAMLIFSCIGRQITLGPMMDEEISGLSKTWSVPAAGFLALGEFGSVLGGKPEYHGTTCSWVTIKEK